MSDRRKKPEILLGEKITLEDHITEKGDVVLLHSNAVYAMYALDGLFPNTADAADLAQWFDQIHDTWRNVAAEDIEIHIYQCRGEAEPEFYHDGPHVDDFAYAFAESYRENMFRNSLYLNKLFLGITVHPPSATSQKFSRFFADSTADPRAGILARKDRLNELCQLLDVQLSAFKLSRLGYVQRGHVICSEIAEALVLAMTGKWRSIPLTTGRLGYNMFSEQIRFIDGRIRFNGAGEPSYGEIFTFKDPPVTTWPGMFHDLTTVPYYCTLVQSFRFLSNAASMAVINRKQNLGRIAKDKGAEQLQLLTHAASELTDRKWVIGSHSLLFLVFSHSESAMALTSNAAWRDLAKCSLVAIRMTKALQGAFLSLAPGGEIYRPRPNFLKSSNFVAFSPLYNWPSGQVEGQWGGPIITLRTAAGTPFYFHWHPPGLGGNGNTLITGMPGAGKTTLTGALITFSAGRARIVALDHKRGWDHLIRRLGGDYDVLGNGRPVFAPLKALEDTPADREHLIALFRGCIGGVMTEEESRRLTLGIATILAMPSAQRSVGELRGFFDNTPEGAGVRLEKWILGNELGWVLDAPADNVRFGRLSGLDTTALLDNARARGPAMAHLFYRISRMLDGTPFLLPIDEGWRALQDETFRPNIEKYIRTIRSKGGAVVFIAQSGGDLVEAAISRILIEMCPTALHGYNPRAKESDYVGGLGLTEGQYEALCTLKPGLGFFLVTQGTDAVVAQLPLSREMSRFTNILSAREQDLVAEDKRITAAVNETTEEALV